MTTLHSVADLVDWLGTEPAARLIGIVGPPGSGKSTLAEELITLLGDSAIVVPMDGFHYPQAKLVELGRRERMGAPDTFDRERFAEKLSAVVARDTEVFFPSFDRNIEEPVEDQIVVTPEHERVVVEGNYLLLDYDGWDRVGTLLDVTVYLDIADSVRQERLIARHVAFGKTPEHAVAWVEAVDEANAAVIARSAPRAAITLSRS